MNGSRANVMVIKTPEGVSFALPLASPVTRMLAWMLDFVVTVVLWVGLAIAISVFAVVGGDLAGAAYYLGLFAISIGYSLVTEWYWRGQTWGKRLLRLRVVDSQGLHLQFNQILVRNLLRFVDCLPFCYLVGGLTSLCSRRCQRLGDIAANTVVIRIPKLTEPDLEQLFSGKFNSLRRYPHLVGRLRQRATPAEAAVALQALLRREEFTPAGRVELFADLVRHFSQIVTFPAEATEGITDEQYIRNIVEVLYRTEPETK
jgi:uncharacterized RDD family membrane protein YckC